MNYWWVNQKQTWEHEISGRYMWSPTSTRNGRKNHFYDNMLRVQAGDIVFSYFNGLIQYLGVVLQAATPCPKPLAFSSAGASWNLNGWTVPVNWTKLPTPLRPRDHLPKLWPVLPVKYSPLHRVKGTGLQNVYLAEVPHEMAEVLLHPMGAFARDLIGTAPDQPEEDGPVRLVEDELERVIKNDTSIDTTEKEALINARRGQGRFRQNLESIEAGCRLTGVTERRLLKASHVKPWRSCESNQERIDGYNGLLLTPSMDHIFDRGLISFLDNGDLLISSRIAPEELARLGLNVSGQVNVGPFAPQQTVYLAYHRAMVFR